MAIKRLWLEIASDDLERVKEVADKLGAMPGVMVVSVTDKVGRQSLPHYFTEDESQAEH